jgi:bisphosphoglycerate-independent phosphoglycerate mutase (AlkP superfamily)
MGEIFTPIHTVRSGRHSNEGALWFRTGEHVVHDGPVQLEDIAPTVMRLLGVTPPEHMTGRVLPVAGVTAQS